MGLESDVNAQKDRTVKSRVLPPALTPPVEQTQLLNLQLITNSLISVICVWFQSLGHVAYIRRCCDSKEKQCQDSSGCTCFLHPWLEKFTVYGQVLVLTFWQTYISSAFSILEKWLLFNADCLCVCTLLAPEQCTHCIYIQCLKVCSSQVVASECGHPT